MDWPKFEAELTELVMFHGATLPNDTAFIVIAIDQGKKRCFTRSAIRTTNKAVVRALREVAQRIEGN